MNATHFFKNTFLFLLFLCFYSTLYSQNPCECALVTNSANACPTPTLYPSLTSALNATDGVKTFSPALSFTSTNQTYTFCTRYTIPFGVSSVGLVNFMSVNNTTVPVSFSRTAWTAYNIDACTNPIIGSVKTTSIGGAAEFTVATGNTYKFCVSVQSTTNNSNSTIQSTELYLYNSTAPSSTCTSSVGTFTIKKNGTISTGTSFDLLPNEKLELISNNDFVVPPKAGADNAGLGFAGFKCNPSAFDLTNKATFATATNSCFAGFYYNSTFTDINDGTSTNSAGVQLGNINTFWMVPVTFDDICSPSKSTATCKTGDTNIGIDINGDNCFKAGTPFQINYVQNNLQSGTCDTPNGPVTQVATFADRNYDANCQEFSTAITNTVLVTYHTVKTDATGSLGLVQSIDATYGSITRSAVLRPKIATCTATDITTNVTNANALTSGFNPQWYNLSPNTDYVAIITTTIPANSEYKKGCLNAYGIPCNLNVTSTQTNVSCNGGNNGSASLFVSGGVAPFSYSWSPTVSSFATLTGLSAGSYSCVINDSRNCKIYKTITITEPSTLTITTTITPTAANLNVGNDALFQATSGGSNLNFQWQTNSNNLGWQNIPNNLSYLGANTASLTVKNVQLGNHLQPFRVIATSGNCTDTSDVASIHVGDTCLITVHDTLVINRTITGLSAPNNKNTIKVYPNPAKDHVIIHYGNFAIMNGYSVKITNTLGQELFASPINQQTSSVNLSNWINHSLYFVQIIDPQGKTVETRKILIE